MGLPKKLRDFRDPYRKLSVRAGEDLTKAGFMLWKKGTGDWEKGG